METVRKVKWMTGACTNTSFELIQFSFTRILPVSSVVPAGFAEERKKMSDCNCTLYTKKSRRSENSLSKCGPYKCRKSCIAKTGRIIINIVPREYWEISRRYEHVTERRTNKIQKGYGITLLFNYMIGHSRATKIWGGTGLAASHLPSFPRAPASGNSSKSPRRRCIQVVDLLPLEPRGPVGRSSPTTVVQGDRCSGSSHSVFLLDLKLPSSSSRNM